MPFFRVTLAFRFIFFRILDEIRIVHTQCGRYTRNLKNPLCLHHTVTFLSRSGDVE